MNILWLTNVPSPYRVNFFNELGKECELTVLFEKSSSNEREKGWELYEFKTFIGVLLNGWEMDVDKSLSLTVVKYLRKKYDHIVISNVATPTGIIAINYLKLFKIPYIIEGDGGFSKSGMGIKEKLKKNLIKGASAYFSTSEMHDSYYIQYGAIKEKIYRYPFTSLKEIDLLKAPINKYEKQQLKNKMNIKDDIVILSVGQFIYRKGFDVLLKACSMIDVNIGVYIIGGKATDEYIDIIDMYGLSNVHIEEFKNKNELSDYFKISDLFVLPTREDIWGLVINEAMAHALPVITTNRCIAGLELIINNHNGFLVSVDHPLDLANKINLIINDTDLREIMAKNSLEKIKNYTIEQMTKCHIQIFKELL